MKKQSKELLDKKDKNGMVDATNDGIRKIMRLKMLKKLGKFTYFDLSEFLIGKKLMSIGQQEWKDYNTGERLGTKVEVVIAQDKTDYGVTDGETVSNLYEKLVIKVHKMLNVPMNVEVRPINAEAVVYGEYRNQLSITAEDIEISGK